MNPLPEPTPATSADVDLYALALRPPLVVDELHTKGKRRAGEMPEGLSRHQRRAWLRARR